MPQTHTSQSSNQLDHPKAKRHKEPLKPDEHHITEEVGASREAMRQVRVSALDGTEI